MVTSTVVCVRALGLIESRVGELSTKCTCVHCTLLAGLEEVS